MRDRSIFRQMMDQLIADWVHRFPGVAPIRESHAAAIPVASTLYAGFSAVCKKHIFLWFQHSSKAWEAGAFTINVIVLKKRKCRHAGIGFWQAGRPLGDLPEGNYRIGDFTRGADLWWHLRSGDRGQVRNPNHWCPRDSRNAKRVVASAIDDVSGRVARLIRTLKVSPLRLTEV